MYMFVSTIIVGVRSIVPMIHLTWNLARHIRVTDTHFYSQVRYVTTKLRDTYHMRILF